MSAGNNSRLLTKAKARGLLVQRRLPNGPDASRNHASLPALQYQLGHWSTSEADQVSTVSVAVIDGPHDAATLSRNPQPPIELGTGHCGNTPNSACDHGTFVLGLLGARGDAVIPGLCPGCQLLHIPLFVDEHTPSASVEELANAVTAAVAAGATLINLSLAILGDGSEANRHLAAALDHAEASGAVVVAGSRQSGPIGNGAASIASRTFPVVAVDATGRLLPDCNFGPAILRRGVAALGHHVLGYAPGAKTTVMSGTSVATAVATAALARVWSAHPDADGYEIRAAVTSLISHNGSIPPMLDANILSAVLDRTRAAADAAASLGGSWRANYASLQGGTTMTNEKWTIDPSNSWLPPGRPLRKLVAPAGGQSGCGCNGVCTCTNQDEQSGFVYAIGTVEAEYPNAAIELNANFSSYAASSGLAVCHRRADERYRRPKLAVCCIDRATKLTRYIARQLSWRLTIEGLTRLRTQPAGPQRFRRVNQLPELPKIPQTRRGNGGDAGNGKREARKEARNKKDASGRKETNGSILFDSCTSARATTWTLSSV